MKLEIRQAVAGAELAGGRLPSKIRAVAECGNVVGLRNAELTDVVGERQRVRQSVPEITRDEDAR